MRPFLPLRARLTLVPSASRKWASRARVSGDVSRSGRGSSRRPSKRRTNFSVCRTFSPCFRTVLSAASCASVRSRPKSARACPSLILPASSASCTGRAAFNSRSVLETTTRLLPTRRATCPCVSPNPSTNWR